MNEKKNTPAVFIELLKLYSDTEMVHMIHFAKQDVGAEIARHRLPDGAQPGEKAATKSDPERQHVERRRNRVKAWEVG